MRKYVERVRAEGLGPASTFATGPFPGDILTRRGDTDVTFETPAQTVGVGTAYTAMAKGSRPIDGFAAMIGDENNVVLLAMRVPEAQDALISTIVVQARRESRKLAHAFR
jgi:hypothetical protein